MTEEDDVLEPTCEYYCDGYDWVLVDGTAPEGYYCPEIFGGCIESGETMMVEPQKIPPPPPQAVASASTVIGDAIQDETHSGEYQFDIATDTLYFSRGSTVKGFRFLAKIPMNELRERFPAVAAEVELLKNAKSLMSFTVEVPAIPIVKR